MVQNSLVQREKQKFSMAIQSDNYKRLINDTLGDPKVVQRFIGAVTSAVSVNPALQDCEPSTILSAALLGESLNLSPSPQLGQYYMVPFNDNRNGRVVATFQLGYKGYLQLATRSGYYKKINVEPIKEGELIKWNPLAEEIEFIPIEDEEAREKAATIGYYAMFEYLNGFTKVMYWSRAKMEAHALKYSKGYAAKKGYTFWEKEFDAMGCKTMIRQLISKWGIMSIEFQRAYERDGTYSTDANNQEPFEYVDNIEVEAQVDEVKPPKEIKPTGKGKSKNPLAGTPFDDNSAPDFVTEVEEGRQ